VADPASRDLHEQILAAAKGLFIQYGYHGLAMRQIAEAVGVSKAALYYHFRDKEELFLAILETYLDELEALLERIAAEETTSRGRITAVVREILSQPAEERAVIRLFSQEMAQLSAPTRQAFHQVYHQKFLNRIETIFREGMERGELRQIDPSLATWALLGMMYPYSYPAHMNEMPAPADVAGKLAQIILDGLATG
jgi:AcrR family transcriptional regulator